MNATQGVKNRPGVTLPQGANLTPGAKCAHEHGLKIAKQQEHNKRRSVKDCASVICESESEKLLIASLTSPHRMLCFISTC